MSIIQSLAKIKQSKKNAKSKNATCDADLTIDGDSPTLSTNTQPSHPEASLGLLDYELSKEASERAEMKPRGKIHQTTLIAKDTPPESMRQDTLQLVLYENTKMSFLNNAKSLLVQCEKNMKRSLGKHYSRSASEVQH